MSSERSNDLLSQVAALAQERRVDARARYSSTVVRLAEGKPGEEDTPVEIARLLREVGRSPEQLRADCVEAEVLLKLVRRAHHAKHRQEDEEETAAAYSAAKEEFKRVHREWEDRVLKLLRANERAVRASCDASAAREQLLEYFDLREAYCEKVGALHSARTRAQRARSEEETAAAESEYEAAFNAFWLWWAEVRALRFFDPIGREEAARKASPPGDSAQRIEGHEVYSYR